MVALAWHLIKLDGNKILTNSNKRDIKQDKNGNYKVLFKYDLSDKSSIGRDIISSEDKFADNALFFQLRKILFGGSEFKHAENFLRSTLIFVDFKKVFSNVFEDVWSSIKLPLDIPKKTELLTKENLPYRMQLLFKDGIELSFDGKCFKRFVPFDKSSSMARDCQITFIDSQIKAKLDKRLMLDMDFVGKSLVLSKFYAYRGLYLSAASRVENSPSFPLNEETVIVLEDVRQWFQEIKEEDPQEDKRFITTFTASKSGKLWKDEIKKYKQVKTGKESDLKVNLFDGEGLIVPDFANYISDFLQANHNYPKASHSFQIRLPFTKGVLHEVDFNKFFEEYLPAGTEQWLIKDIFGVMRDLRKAKIILTQSMFKCTKWIKDYLQKPDLDPMKIFFEKFAEYEHALYVTTTEARLSNSGRVRLNYQFLSTLALSDEDFDSLVADQRTMIDTFVEKFAKEFSDVQDSTDETYDANEPNDTIFRSSIDRTTCLKALAKNPAFIRDPKVKNIRDDMKKSYECDLGLGRFEVEGEQRFLSCDLLALLIEILKKVQNVRLGDLLLKSLQNEQLRTDRFFMADAKLSIKPDKYYVFLRNPHLSRNEQVFLRAFVKRDSLHKKYFSHLTGVVMVSRTSTAPMALAGADFDGDLVKVISDRRIVKAVKLGNKDLPLIKILSASSSPCKLCDEVSLKVILDTFANKVGLISNWAVKLSEKEYCAEPVEEKYKNACAKCTIVVGLEIDAAKTGSHPQENIEELKDLAGSCGENIFLKSKEVIKQILQNHYSLIVELKNGNLVLYFSKDKKSPKLKVPLEVATTLLLERLPAYYLRLISDRKPAMNESSERSPYFKFETDNLRSSLDESLRGELGKLIAAYQSVLSLNSKLQRTKRRMAEQNYMGHVINTLKLQYDDYRYHETDLDLLYAELSDILRTSAKVKAAIDNLKNQKWHLTREEDRPRVVAEILGLNLSDYEKLPPFFDLLYNFRCNGYLLFYFILEDLEGLLFDDVDFISDDDKSDFKQNPYYAELYQVYLENIAAKKSKRIWNAQLVNICRRHLQEIFDGDMYKALKHYWSQRGNDSRRNFLWNVFNEQKILPYIFTSKAQD